MLKVGSDEFRRDPGRYQDLALVQPVAVTDDGRERTVLISIEEYQRLKRRDREILALEDFSEADIASIEAAEPSAEARRFDDEVEG